MPLGIGDDDEQVQQDPTVVRAERPFMETVFQPRGKASDPLRQVLSSAQEKGGADLAARIRRLQDKTGLPTALIEKDVDGIERQAFSDGFNADQFRRNYPGLAEWASDPKNAAVVYDDLEPMSGLERAVRFPMAAARKVGAGLLETLRLPSVIAKPYAESILELSDSIQKAMTPAGVTIVTDKDDPTTARWKSVSAAATRYDTRIQSVVSTVGGEVPRGSTKGEEFALSGFESFGAAIPATLTTFLTKNPMLGVELMGYQQGGTAAVEALDKGVAWDKAVSSGMRQGIVEAAFELAPATWWLKDIQEHAPFALKLMHQLATEVPGELATTTLQSLDTFVTQNPDAPLADYWKTLPDQLAQTAVATFVMVGLNASLGHAVDKMTNTSASQRMARQIHEATQATQTATRSPEALQSAVQAMSGAGAVSPSVPIEPFIEYFQSKGQAPAAVAERLTGDPNAFARAQESGELDIPLANYVAQVPGSGHESFFEQEVRFAPEQLNARETQEQASVAVASVPIESTSPADTIQARLTQQLVASGRANERDAGVMAQVLAAAFPNIANRTGAQLEQLVEQWLPLVQAGETAVSGELLQVDSPTFLKWFGQSVLRDESGMPVQLFHGTNTSFESFDLESPGRFDSGWLGQGVYLTTNPETAGAYATGRAAQQGRRNEPNIMPFFARLENPHVINVGQELAAGRGFPKDRMALLERTKGRDAAVEESKRMTADLVAKGHDGVILEYTNSAGNVTEREVLVFDPAAVKSAIIERGRIDPDYAALQARALAGGFTYNAVTATSPTQGYALSIFPGRELAVPAGELTEEVVEAYVEKNRDALNRPGAHLGAWLNPEDGKVYLDVSMVATSAQQAESLAREHQQLAYYDLARGETVSVNQSADLERFANEAQAAPAQRGAVERGHQGTGDSAEERRYLQRVDGAKGLDAAPAERKDGALLISTRKPTETGKTPFSNALLTTDFSLLRSLPDKMAQAAELFRSYGLLTGAEKRSTKSAEKTLRLAIDAMKRNLKALHDLFDSDLRERSSHWYLGANRIANELADTYGYTVDQTSGVLAALSPQMDWFRNVNLAERVMTLTKEFDARDQDFTPEMGAWFAERTRSGVETWIRQKKLTPEQATAYRAKKLADIQDVAALVGQRWSALDESGRARLLRIYDELNHPRTYDIISPEGDRTGLALTKDGTPAQVGWGTYAFIENAISILHNGTPENISTRLGTEHKVRSFFNNISHPHDARSVTIDTHAVAAAFLQPFSGQSREVQHAMGTKPKGDTLTVPQHAVSGLSGTNAVIAQAYFELAADLGLDPRALQSITWEAVRGLYKPEQKRGALKTQLDADVAAALQSYGRGKIDHGQLVETLTGLAGGVDVPSWADAPVSEQGRLAVEAVRPRAARVPAGPGGHRSLSTGPAGVAADVTERDGPLLGAVGESRTYAQDDSGIRGSISFSRGAPPVVKLFKARNRSTFLHESGHLFLEMMGSLASGLRAQENLTPEQQQFVADYYDVVLPWLSADEGQLAGTAGLVEKQHEQFARGFEAYLLEGQAPSAELTSVFARVSRWLTTLYKSVAGLAQRSGVDVTLSPEVRAVMARLLASDAAIAEAQARVPASQPLFLTAEQAGVDPVEFAGYRDQLVKASDAARAQLRAEVMKDLVAEDKEQRDAERARITAEATDTLRREPVYTALRAMRKGESPTGEPLPSGPVKLSKASLVAQFGPEILKQLPRPYIYTTEGGVSADVAAELFGFPTGRALLDAVIAAPSFTDAVAARVDQQMLEEHGNPLANSDELQARAEEAVMNTAQDEVVRAELRMLRRLQRNAQPSVRAARDAEAERKKSAVARLRGIVFDPTALERWAGAHVAQLTMKLVSPARFLATSQRAAARAQEFAAAGKVDEAIEQKQQQLTQMALYRQAVALRDEVMALRTLGRTMFRNDVAMAKQRDMNYVNVARALVARYFWPEQAREEHVAEQLKLLQRYDKESFDQLEPIMGSLLGLAPSLATMTGEQFHELKTVVEGLWELSRSSQVQTINGQEVDRDVAVAELTGRLGDLGVAKEGPPPARTENEMRMFGARAALTRVEHWVRYLDGGKDDGVFRKYLFTPMRAALDAYRVARVSTLTEYLELVKTVESTLVRGTIAAPELNYTFESRAALLHAVLHTGNPSNLSKLLRGRNWGTVDENGQLDTSKWDAFLQRAWREGLVTQSDYVFAQRVWDLHERLKGEAQLAHKKVYGRYFGEVTAAPVETPWGRFRGGYVPAVLDPLDSADGTARANDGALEDVDPSMFPVPGFTKERIEAYAQPLALNLALMPSHFDKVLRFIHLLPTGKEVLRLAHDKKFRDAMHRYDPAAVSELLEPWLNRTVAQKVAETGRGITGRTIDRVFSTIRSRTGLNMMAGHVINTLQQFTGITPVLARVDAKYVRNALWRYTRDHKGVASFVNESSPFMRTRLTAAGIEIQSQIDDILLNPSLYEKAQDWGKKHGYVLQAGTQNIVDVVAWSAAYESAVAGGQEHGEAVRRADSVVRETQGSFAAEDLAAFEVTRPYLRVFTMFAGYFNTQANLNAYGMAQVARDIGLRKGAGKMLYLYTVGFMLPAVLSEVIRQSLRGWERDDDDAWLDDVMSTFFGSQARFATGMVPGVGPAVQTGLNMWTTPGTFDDRLTISPAVAAVESTVRAPYSAYQAIAGKGDASTAVRDFLTLLGLATGLPAGAIARPATYLTNVAEGDVQPENALDVARGVVVGR